MPISQKALHEVFQTTLNLIPWLRRIPVLRPAWVRLQDAFYPSIFPVSGLREASDGSPGNAGWMMGKAEEGECSLGSERTVSKYTRGEVVAKIAGDFLQSFRK